MEEKFNWDLPADPDPKSDNYYNGIVSKELKNSSNVAEVLFGVIRRESVKDQSDFVNEGIETILDRLGIVVDTVESYIAGTMPAEIALEQLAQHQPNNQMCLLNQHLIDECLHFKECLSLSIVQKGGRL